MSDTTLPADLLRSLCVGAAVLVLSGCTQLGLWVLNTGTAFERYERTTDIVYAPARANRLDVYLPVHPDHSPVVVFFFGGGWNSGDKASYRFVGAALADAGIIAVVPNYTLYPAAKFPVFMQDAAQAIAWTRSHALEWGGDPDRLYVAGHSAGAQIAIMLALDEKYLKQVGGASHWLRGAVGLAGPYDFLPLNEAYLRDLFGPPASYALSQPINFVRSDAPPLLLMCGLKDQRVDPQNTSRLAAAIAGKGGRVTTRYFDTAGHADLVVAFSNLRAGRLPVLAEIERFIAATTAPH